MCLPRRRRSAVIVPFLLLVACAGPSTAAPSDRLHERITLVEVAADGSARVEFEYSQRRFVIDPSRSPDARAMVVFAQSAKASGKAVHATVAPTGPRTKGDDGPPFVLIRLADTPDPSR